MSSSGISSVKRVDCRAGLKVAVHKVGAGCWLKSHGGTVQWLASTGWSGTNSVSRMCVGLSCRSSAKYLKSAISSLIAWVTWILPLSNQYVRARCCYLILPNVQIFSICVAPRLDSDDEFSTKKSKCEKDHFIIIFTIAKTLNQ